MEEIEMMESHDTPTQDERILAALAHASIILPFWGLVAAIVIWVTQREKSRFVGFQALQGAAYQLSLVLLAILGGICYMCSFFGTFLTLPFGIIASEEATSPSVIGLLVSMGSTAIPFCLMGLFLLVGLVFVLYGLYGAVRVLQGEEFRYAVVGERLERYLNQ
ncbi:MAG TPA: DUF4870 domain-containing protein [Chloroflexi bacterium]|nr:DUF4870 domain-containing protein [Chloroflexota bacterium]